MKLMNSLALRHLKQNKRQALSSFLAITLAVSMLIAVSVFCFSVADAMMEFAKTNDLESTMSSSLESLRIIGVLLGAVISLAAVFVIANAFNIQASERVKQFGILKSVGATEEQIKSTITAESNWLSLIGIPSGIVIGHLLCFLALFLLGNSVDEGDGMSYAVRFNLLAILIASVLGYITIRFASYFTARKVSKLSAIEAIRQTDDIKVKSKQLKTSKLNDKIFGFEGTLASKQLKRNKRKFRVTVYSLVISIVLTIVAFSFGDMLIKTAEGAYANTGANVVAQVISNDYSQFDEFAKKIKEKKVKNLNVVYTYNYYPNDTSKWCHVISLDDDVYNDYCKKAGVKQGSNILLMPPECNIPFDVSLDKLGNFSVTEKATYTDKYLKAHMMTSYPNVIMPKSEAKRLGLELEASYFIEADSALDFIAGIKPQVEDSYDVYFHNTEEYTRQIQRMYAMLMMFVYCFIGMLTLIGATSVLATINNNINLRKCEFATLRAVGMETKKLNKMLNLESVFYGIKSILIGTPIGIILSYVMYELFNKDKVKFMYEIPWLAILICILGVFAINFISMHFATNKIRRSNIAESMRELTT